MGQIPDNSETHQYSSDEVEKLSKEITALDQAIKILGNPQKLREEQMDLLHKYNDVKDAAQIIIGKLADAKAVTFKSIHEDYDLPMND